VGAFVGLFYVHLQWAADQRQRPRRQPASRAVRVVAAAATPSAKGAKQESHTPTVAKEFQIGLYDPTEADLEHFWNCCSGGFLGERL